MGKLGLFCSCGAAFRMNIVGAGSTRKMNELVAIWLDEHKGEGHQRVTSQMAGTSRRRQERESELIDVNGDC